MFIGAVYLKLSLKLNEEGMKLYIYAPNLKPQG